MPQLIKDGAVVTDDWQFLSELHPPEPLPTGKVIVPLAYWREHKEVCANNDQVGVWLEGDTDLAPIGQDLSRLPLVAVNFPGFMDGRGFSSGRLLRERYRLEGELRAIGSIIRDQLCYLRRCGFNAFQFADGEDLNAALESLNDFQEYYQAAVDQPLPLFRRRQA